MNRNVLIDAVVNQATVLIAHLATQGGVRAPLSAVADQVFRSLVAALDQQHVGQKVIADMFGMALRTYYARVRRLSESKTMHGRSLWEAVLSHVRAHGPVRREALMGRFQADDDQVLRAVLHDLVDEGLVVQTGRGATLAYAMASGAPSDAERDALVWVAIFHAGQTTPAAVAEALRIPSVDVTEAIARLVADGRVTHAPGGIVRADVCIIPEGDEAGWEGAVYDHLQAVVGAMCHKLRRLGVAGRGEPIDRAIGGSTYTFDLSPDNPALARVSELLAALRKELSDLRAAADAFEVDRPPRGRTRFVFYLGENVLADRLPVPAAVPGTAAPTRPARARSPRRAK